MVREASIDVGGGTRVSALLQAPADPQALFVLAHGAGAGMRHPFLENVAGALEARGVATLRYRFPYMEAKRRRPDPPALLQSTVGAAIAAAAQLLPSLPLFAGGKSMGGRMTSSFIAGRQRREAGVAGVDARLVAAPAGIREHASDDAAMQQALQRLRGLIFLGFPLHAANRPDLRRAEHLDDVPLPMLFLQGTRDALASLPLVEQVTKRLGGRATLHVVEGADHGFAVPKRSGQTPGDVMDELSGVTAGWIARLR